MKMELNWLEIVLATVASMIVAGIWYQDFAFGQQWRAMTQIDVQRSQKAGNTPLLVLLVLNFLTAVVLALTIAAVEVYFSKTSLWMALLTGLAVWLAFSATTLLTHNMFEQKPLKLTLLNNGYQLLMFLVMSLIIGVM